MVKNLTNVNNPGGYNETRPFCGIGRRHLDYDFIYILCFNKANSLLEALSFFFNLTNLQLLCLLVYWKV